MRTTFRSLLEDPETFQTQYHTLCRLDGSLPEEGDDSTEDSVLAWNACPVLRELELGDYDYDIFGGIITGQDPTTAPSSFRSSPRAARAVSREATASSGRGRDPT